MNQQKMFAEEQYIRDLHKEFSNDLKSEKERYNKFKEANPGSSTVLNLWKKRIIVRTKVKNFLANHMTDYMLEIPGTLKYVAQAKKEVANANITLHYLQQLNAQRAKREAAILAENLAFEIMGDQVNQLLPAFRERWREAVDAEYAIHEEILRDRRAINE